MYKDCLLYMLTCVQLNTQIIHHLFITITEDQWLFKYWRGWERRHYGKSHVLVFSKSLSNSSRRGVLCSVPYYTGTC